MTVRLHINIDHVATVRNARGTRYPDPVLAAQICEAAGVDGITVHLREDRRHIKDDDLERLRASVTTTLNLEMAVTDEMFKIAERVRPDVVTLVPERRAEQTTEGGLDVRKSKSAIDACVAMARASGIRVSLFINPEAADVEASKQLGVHQVELHTGEYCLAAEPGKGSRIKTRDELSRIVASTIKGGLLGLDVAAGHGLTRANVGAVVGFSDGGGIKEVNIGHSVVADAVLYGLDRAVRELRAVIERRANARTEAP